MFRIEGTAMTGTPRPIPDVLDVVVRSADRAPTPISWPPKVALFGIGVSVTDYAEATATILQAARQGLGGVVSCHAVHAIVTASGDASLGVKVNTFELLCPDGQPVRWAVNLLHGTQLSDRVYGPELMLRLCRRAAETGVSVYLYGGDPVVAERLEANLLHLYPKLHIAGCEAPPFRPLQLEEDRAVVERINRSGAGLVFIGLGCPKQDLFAYEHRNSLQAVQVCVGAAFDFHAGVKKMAPRWMQRHGLEWLYRVSQEPGRLWRRYLITNSLFLMKLGMALIRSVVRGS
ncbi:MAG TPA: WecB/TagA/CpsF family glycosyltransferase [Gemmataceae bacterium]|nr:WecB/TagA/CpsF family glycosyltransferase [Gemmataceae bacterium]